MIFTILIRTWNVIKKKNYIFEVITLRIFPICRKTFSFLIYQQTFYFVTILCSRISITFSIKLQLCTITNFEVC